MDGNGRTSDGPASHTPDGKFAPGNKCSNGGRLGVPNKTTWIREQIQDTCSDASIARLKALGESSVPADLAIYWQIIGKTLPQHVQAEIGEIGSLGAECDAALVRAGLDGKFKTELGE